jgi:excinuclease ABC subunit A
VKPWQSESYASARTTSCASRKRRGMALDIAWRDLPPEQRRWVHRGRRQVGLEGRHWYGVKRFFEWLETKAYKMHIRVLLSRYRAYTPCRPATARA